MSDKAKTIEKAVEQAVEQTVVQSAEQSVEKQMGKTVDPGSVQAAHDALTGIVDSVEWIHDSLQEDSARAASLRSFLKMLSHEIHLRIRL